MYLPYKFTIKTEHTIQYTTIKVFSFTCSIVTVKKTFFPGNRTAQFTTDSHPIGVTGKCPFLDIINTSNKSKGFIKTSGSTNQSGFLGAKLARS